MMVVPNQAFTSSYKGLSLQLKNKVIVFANDKSIEVDALWDTGATNTVISRNVVSELGLISSGKMKVKTPSGSDIYNTYLVNIGLPNHVMITDLCVCDSEIGDQGVGVLIGMDIIAKGDFAVSNYNGITRFTFRIPSIKVTDYVKENTISNVMGPCHGKGKRKKK